MTGHGDASGHSGAVGRGLVVRGLVVRGARARIVAWVWALVFAALALATVTTWRLLVADTHSRIDTALQSEIGEFVALTSDGRDPGADNEPFTSVAEVLHSAITYNLAQPNEKFLGYVDGAFRYQSRFPAPVSLPDDAAFTRLVARTTRPVQGTYQSAAGPVRYMGVPVLLQEHPGHGVVVVAYFVNRELAAANNAARLMAGAGAVTSVLAAAAAWVVAGRILQPVRDIAQTAQSITERDLSARIPIRSPQGAGDEIGQLAQTVNAMLDRVQDGARAQRRFVDDAGHELRTPITIVRGHLEVLDPADPADVRATVTVVDDELGRMNRIVSDLLTLAKAEQPQFVRREPTDVWALLEETVIKARQLAPRQWTLAARPDLAVVGGAVSLDAQRITQALLVLADNAARHTAESDTIELGAALDNEIHGRVLRMWVADTGSGVAIHDRGRIFDRFARGTSEPRSEGAGLGLTIASAITAAHGGRIELGEGLEPTVTFGSDSGNETGHSGPGVRFTLILPCDPNDTDSPGSTGGGLRSRTQVLLAGAASDGRVAPPRSG